MGRPTSCTPEITTKICDYLKQGLSKDDAAVMVGIHRATLYDWQKKHPDFLDAVEKAITEFKLANLKVIQQAAKPKTFGGGGSWQASAWMLERKFQNEYYVRQRLEHGFDERMLQEIASKIIAIVHRVAPDICPGCKTHLNISPKIAEELIALSGELVK